MLHIIYYIILYIILLYIYIYILYLILYSSFYSSSPFQSISFPSSLSSLIPSSLLFLSPFLNPFLPSNTLLPPLPFPPLLFPSFSFSLILFLYPSHLSSFPSHSKYTCRCLLLDTYISDSSPNQEFDPAQIIGGECRVVQFYKCIGSV